MESCPPIGGSSKLARLLKYACPPGPGIGCWDRLIGSIVLQVYSGRRHRYDGYEGAQLPTTPRGYLARRPRAKRQLLPPSSGEARSLLRERTGGGSLRRLGPSERRPRSLLPFATGHVL